MIAVLLIVLNACVVVVLAVVAIDDWRNYRIKNAFIVALLILSIARIVVVQDAALFFSAALFFTVGLVAMMFAFHRNLVGGGDAKLMSVAFLYVGPQSVLVFAICLLLCTLLYFAAAKLDLAPFQRVGGRMRVPFGPCIAGAWILTILASAALVPA